MPYQPSDETREKIAAAGRMAANASRSYGPPLGAWLWKNRYGVVIAILLLYILWPKSEPKNVEINTNGPVVVASNGHAGAPSTKPTTQESNDSVAGIPLFTPGAEGSDAKWSKPAELSGADLQEFAREVDELAKTTEHVSQLGKAFDYKSMSLASDSVVDLYWQALRGKGFKDQTLPHKWSATVEDHTDLIAQMGGGFSLLFDYTIRNVVTYRLDAVKIRLVGGQLLIGDELFVKSFGLYIRQRETQLQKFVDDATDVARRTDAEFGTSIDKNTN